MTKDYDLNPYGNPWERLKCAYWLVTKPDTFIAGVLNTATQIAVAQYRAFLAREAHLATCPDGPGSVIPADTPTGTDQVNFPPFDDRLATAAEQAKSEAMNG